MDSVKGDETSKYGCTIASGYRVCWVLTNGFFYLSVKIVVFTLARDKYL
jgi:hypothetical protein